ncbi:MAG: hypothetical protein DRH26_05350 [Deltaproteobacteria bacterium]|nr:MAG: hypothetical protein DRH26_05350 [Deltaproteobacteria bacterium]
MLDKMDMVYEAVIKMRADQKHIKSDVTEIKSVIKEIPCKVNTYKISLLQKVVYGGVALVLLAFAAELTDQTVSSAFEFIQGSEICETVKE